MKSTPKEISNMKLRLLTEEDKPIAIDLLSNLVASTEITFLGLGYTTEEVRLYADIEVTQSIKKKLAIGAFIDEKMIAINTCQDIYDFIDPDEKASELSESFKQKQKRWDKATEKFCSDELAQLFSKEGKKPYEVIFVGMGTVLPEYREAGVINHIVDFLINKHPLTVNTKHFLAFVVSFIGYKVVQKLGDNRILLEIPYKDLYYEGKHVFTNLDAVLKIHPNLMKDKLIWVCFEKSPKIQPSL